jgi:hypothetical protein
VTRKQNIVTTSGLALAAIVTTAAPVQAAPLEHEHFSDTNIEVIEDYCDLPGFTDLTVLREQYFDGQFLVKTQGADGLVYGMDHVSFVTVRTNVANGKSITTEGQYNNRDQRVTDNGDGTLTIRSAFAGSDQSYDTTGDVVQRTAGHSVFEVLVDHGGTPTDPSDDEFLEFLGVTMEVGHNSDTRDFCEIVHENLT